MAENQKGSGVLLAIIAIIVAIIFFKSGSIIFYVLGGAGALYLLSLSEK